MWFFSHVYSIPIFGLFLNKYAFSLVKETLSKTSYVCWVMNMIALRHLENLCYLTFNKCLCDENLKSDLPCAITTIPITNSKSGGFPIGLRDRATSHLCKSHGQIILYAYGKSPKNGSEFVAPGSPALWSHPLNKDENLLLSKSSTKSQQLGWCLVLPNRHKIQGFWIHNSIQIQTESLRAVQLYIWGDFAEESNRTQDLIQLISI